jgi:hypothetical protein
MWCFFMENARNADNYVPRRDEKISPYALAHSHVEFKRNSLALRCKRAGCLAYCHISQEVRTKMGLRGSAAILLCEAIFSGYAGYWFLSIGTAVLFVCDLFTMIETELPFRNPRVWESFGMTFGDRDASFGVQIVAQHRRGYVTDLMVPLDLSYKLPKSVSEKFGFTVEDEMLSPAKERRIMNVGRRHRNKATGLTMPDATGQPIFATRPPPVPRLPPLHFPGDHEGAGSAGGEPELEDAEEEEKHMETNADEEQYEVDRIYAPAPGCWWLTKDGECITVQQFDAIADGLELSKDDYELWLKVSFVSYYEDGVRAKYDTSFDGIAEGKKRDAWELKYKKKAQKLLDIKLSHDQAELRKRRTRRASAHFAMLPDLMASMKKGEEVTSAAVGKMLKRKGTTPQRAYRAWSRQVVAAEEREVDFVVRVRESSVSSLFGGQAWCGGAYGECAEARHAHA